MPGFGFRDAWAIGVTDRYTLGIWMGRPDGTPNPGHLGANSAAPLFRDLAAALGPSTSRQQLGPLHLKLQGGDPMLTALDGRGKFAQVRFVVRTE